MERTAQANLSPTDRLSGEDAKGLSSKPSRESHTPSPSLSVGEEPLSVWSVPHLCSSSLLHPSPSMSPRSPAVALPSCMNTVIAEEVPG